VSSEGAPLISSVIHKAGNVDQDRKSKLDTEHVPDENVHLAVAVVLLEARVSQQGVGGFSRHADGQGAHERVVVERRFLPMIRLTNLFPLVMRDHLRARVRRQEAHGRMRRERILEDVRRSGTPDMVVLKHQDPAGIRMRQKMVHTALPVRKAPERMIRRKPFAAVHELRPLHRFSEDVDRLAEAGLTDTAKRLEKERPRTKRGLDSNRERLHGPTSPG